jgi:hypothetical protein
LPFILAASYALAALSSNLLEKPFLSQKRFFQSKGERVVTIPTAEVRA